jgi:Ca2+-binding RTX toxin-like protein
MFRGQYETGPLSGVYNTQLGLSAHIDGAQAVFYSGVSVGGAPNSALAADFVRTVNEAAGHTAAYTFMDTARGQYLSGTDAGAAIQQAINSINAQRTTAGLPELTLDQRYALTEPLFRSGSTAMGHEAVGDARFFSDDVHNTVLFDNELPAFLSNDQGGAAEGVSRTELSSLSHEEQLSRIANESRGFVHDDGGYDPVSHRYTFDGESGSQLRELSNGPTLPAELQSRVANAEFTDAPTGFHQEFSEIPASVGEVASFLEGAGRALGVLGMAGMAADSILSTQQAYGQIAAGNLQGALTTEMSLAGRLALGWLGAESGAIIGFEWGSLLGPEGAAGGALLGGLIGGASGLLDGDNLGHAAAEGLGSILASLGFPVPGGGAPWNLGDILHPRTVDPLVIDLNGNGFDLITVSQSQAHVDFGADGYAERVGWVAPSDGFLAIDANNDGAIATPTEFIGSATVDGFAALALLDTNHDGKIDAQDADFAKLRVWRDLNGDGHSDAGEVTTLAQNSITSISLATTASGASIAGNQIGFTSTLTHSDGTTATVGSAYFATDAVLSQWMPPSGFVVSEAASKLPTLAGYGQVKDLASAMTLDDTLRQSVQTLVTNSAGMSSGQLRAAFENVVLKWANAESIDPASRGVYVDARHLAVLEAFYGTAYTDPSGDPNPHHLYGPGVEAAYQNLISSDLLQFAGQMPVSYAQLTGDGSGLSSSPYTPLGLLAEPSVADPLHFDAAVMLLRSFAPAGADAALEYYGHAMPVLAGAIVNVFGGNAAAYAAQLQTDFQDRPDLAELVDLAMKPLLFGGPSADTVNGTAGQEVLCGRTGNDDLYGDAGDDFYVYDPGDGADRIFEGGSNTWSGGSDTLQLGSGLNSTNLVLARSGNSVTLSFTGQSGSVYLDNEFGSFSAGVETIKFGDAVIWSKALLGQAFVQQNQTAGADTISGFDALNDTLTGGLGNDDLNGGAGDDVYVFNAGDGADRIFEGGSNTWSGGSDTLQLGSGLNSTNLVLARSGNNITLSFTGQSGSVYLDNEFGSFTAGVETIKFGDAVTWSKAQLGLAYIQKSQTAGADTISGFDALNDTLTGGLGNDDLNGGAGDDVYVFNAGDGADRIFEGGSNTWSGGSDTLQLGSGLNSTNLVLARSGNNITLSFTGQNGSVYLDNEFGSFTAGVETIKFGDAVTWSKAELGLAYIQKSQTAGADTISGFDALNDTLTGGLGNDDLNGGAGDDVYVFNAGDGADRIFEGGSNTWSGGSDTLLLGQGLTAANLVVTRVGTSNSVTLSFTGQSGSVYLDNEWGGFTSGVETIRFADGTTLTASDLLQRSIGYTDGNDTLNGNSSANVLAGGLGNDDLYGAQGNDLYLFNAGDGADRIFEGGDNWTNGGSDTLQLGTGLNSTNLLFARSGNSVTLSFTGQSGSVYLDNEFGAYTAGVETIKFGDGVTWSRAQLGQAFIQQSQTAGADTISGFDVLYDTITGGLGNDDLNGGASNDLYVFNAGDGTDRIFEGGSNTWSGGSDTLQFGAGLNSTNLVLARSGNSITLSFTGQAGSVYLDGEFSGYTAGVETIRFGDGVTWSTAGLGQAFIRQSQTAGADTISGFDILSDTITGGLGNDDLYGGGGNEVYVFNAGDGADRIFEGGNNWFNGGSDTLQLGNGLNSTNLVLARSGNSITLSFTGQAGSVYLDSEFSGWTAGVETIRFGDGAAWSMAGLGQAYVQQSQTAGSDTIYGFDILSDTITGGLGNDDLYGGSANDLYVFNAGDGNDRIFEIGNFWTNGGSDTLQFGAGLNSTNLVLARSGNSFTLSFTGQSGSVYLDNELSGWNSGVETIRFADGVVWGSANLMANYGVAAGTAGNDQIVGFASYNDTIEGKGGNDTLSGSSGSDTFIFRAGFGKDVITDFAAGSDHVNFSSTLFSSFADVTAHAQQVGSNVVITYDADDTVTLNNVTLSSLQASDFLFTA